MIICITTIKYGRLIYFTVWLFVIRIFLKIVQGQMNEKYYVISGRKNVPC